MKQKIKKILSLFIVAAVVLMTNQTLVYAANEGTISLADVHALPGGLHSNEVLINIDATANVTDTRLCFDDLVVSEIVNSNPLGYEGSLGGVAVSIEGLIDNAFYSVATPIAGTSCFYYMKSSGSLVAAGTAEDIIKLTFDDNENDLTFNLNVNTKLNNGGADDTVDTTAYTVDNNDTPTFQVLGIKQGATINAYTSLVDGLDRISMENLYNIHLLDPTDVGARVCLSTEVNPLGGQPVYTTKNCKNLDVGTLEAAVDFTDFADYLTSYTIHIKVTDDQGAFTQEGPFVITTEDDSTPPSVATDAVVSEQLVDEVTVTYGKASDPNGGNVDGEINAYYLFDANNELVDFTDQGSIRDAVAANNYFTSVDANTTSMTATMNFPGHTAFVVVAEDNANTPNYSVADVNRNGDFNGDLLTNEVDIVSIVRHNLGLQGLF